MNINNWDIILEKIIVNEKLNLQLISPYGFEVINNRKYTQYNLKRFYVYYKGNVEECFFISILSRYLKKNHFEFYNDIGVIGSRRYGFLQMKASNLNINDIFISVEKINTTENLLHNYSTYLSCSFSALSQNILPELSRIQYNSMARLRIRQLFKMYQNLYKKFFTSEMNVFIDSLSYSASEINFINHKEYPTNKDKDDIRQIIDYCKILENKLCQDNLTSHKVNMYGSDKIIIFYLNKKEINFAINKVIMTYKSLHKRILI